MHELRHDRICGAAQHLSQGVSVQSQGAVAVREFGFAKEPHGSSFDVLLRRSEVEGLVGESVEGYGQITESMAIELAPLGIIVPRPLRSKGKSLNGMMSSPTLTTMPSLSR